MAKYAEGTDVSIDRSRAEIERTLKRFGATGFLYGWEGDRHALGFQHAGRQIKYILPMPDRSEFRLTPTGQRRSQTSMDNAYEQAIRERWRALVLLVKAKLAGVEAGISSFEEEFLANTVVPGGATVSQWLIPQLEDAYRQNRVPPMLPLYDDK